LEYSGKILELHLTSIIVRLLVVLLLAVIVGNLVCNCA